jgi:hypothetical protein
MLADCTNAGADRLSIIDPSSCTHDSFGVAERKSGQSGVIRKVSVGPDGNEFIHPVAEWNGTIAVR